MERVRWAWSKVGALLLALTLLGAACSADPVEPPKEEEKRPASIELFSVNPELLTAPGEVILSWEVLNATSVEILQDGETVHLADASAGAGTWAVLVESSTAFELVATGAFGQPARMSRTVELEDRSLPTIGSFSAPASVAASELGSATVLLSWSEVERATSLVLQGEVGGVAIDEVVIDAASIPEGSVEVEIDADASFTLVATNAFGEAQATATVHVVGPPAIVTFTADREHLGVGEAVRLRWTTAGASHVEIWIDRTPLGSVNPQPANGELEIPVYLSSTFELHAFNEARVSVVSELEVIVRAPVIVSFEGNPEARWLGQPLDLSWELEGASSLLLRDFLSGEMILETDDPTMLTTGSSDWEIASVGDHVFELEARNGSGVMTRLWSVSVGTGPTIEEFSANPTALSEGDQLTLRWTTGVDPAGEVPTLTLEDDLGTTYLADRAAGTVSLTPPLGARVFHLKATTSNPLSTPATAEVRVGVFAKPEVHLVASPTHFDERIDDEVVLSWTSSNASALYLYEVLEGNRTTLITTPEGDLSAGSYTLVPRDDVTYRMVAWNEASHWVQSEAPVSLAPPQILQFELAPEEVLPGDVVRLEWETTMADEISLDLFETPYLREETREPYIDAASQGGTHLPMTTACGPGIATNSCALLNFPSSFSFPFDGEERRVARVYTNGFISFDHAHTASASDFNWMFPTTGLPFVHIAPFWDGLGWDLGSYPAGNVHYLYRQEPAGDSLVIQWKDVGFAATNLRASPSLNFEVILWASGAFEYRYGTMDAGNASADWANGGSATLGFQSPSQTLSDVLNLNGLRGSLGDRSFRYRPSPAVTKSGEFEWQPFMDSDSFMIELTARRGTKYETRTLGLIALRPATLAITSQPTAPVEVGATFRIGWTTSYAQSVEVMVEGGATICAAANQAQVNEYFCEITAAAEGTHRYVVRAQGARGVVEERWVEVRVFENVAIRNFEADRSVVDFGEGVTLSWTTTSNAQQISLEANGIELLPAGAPAGLGGLTVPNLEQTTTFVLEIKNSLGLSATESVTVEVRRIDLVLEPSEVRARPGEDVTISLSALALDGGAPPNIFGTMPMAEVSDPGSAYADISAVGEQHPLWPTETSTITMIDLPEGFVFPFFGEEMSRVRIFVDGYVSFDPSAQVQAANQALPNRSAPAYQGVHLAPFWDDLHPQGIGKLHTARTAPDTFVIQWSKMSMAAGSTGSAIHDLNFQLVLFSSGAFEYRYGTMAGLSGTTSSACFPNTCAQEANGASATIGYQLPDRQGGVTAHFGGTTNKVGNQPFPGNLGGRTLRYQPFASTGHVQLSPMHSTTYTFCAGSGVSHVCKDLEVRVDFGIESFTADLQTIDLGQEVLLSWRTAGGTRLNIRTGDTNVFTTTTLAEVDQGTFRVTPTETQTYTLEMSAPENSVTATVDIEVIRMRISASGPVRTTPRDPVTLFWDLDLLDPAMEVAVIKPMVESSAHPFSALDLSGDPTATVFFEKEASNYIFPLTFGGGFTFDYFGTKVDKVMLSSEGYVSVGTYGGSLTANQRLPNDKDRNHHIHMAVFWEDLNQEGVGQVLGKLVDPDTYVIQWSHTMLDTGTSQANPSDLNFMLVLHRNGDFEYRFGTMAPPPNPAREWECYPASCINEVNGSSATIGYQLPDGSAGSLVHFGGSEVLEGQKPVAGGLSNRSWIYTRASATGQVLVTPWDSTTYEICAVELVSQELACAEPVDVVVSWGIRVFEANPEIVMEGDPLTLRWEVEGLDELVLRADGVEVVSYSGPTIPPTHALTFTPLASALYQLEGTSLGRSVVRELQVDFKEFDFDLELSPGPYFPGNTVQVSWDAVPVPGSRVSILGPMREVPAGTGDAAAFVDIADLGTIHSVTNVNSGYVTVDLPFTFPYFGKEFLQAQVYVDGHVSFTIGGNSSSNNVALPGPAARQRVHLAPFWDDLRIPNGGGIFTYMPDANTFIIQYEASLGYDQLGSAGRLDMQFQVVLFADGSFEYRYGTMETIAGVSSWSCDPSTCEDEVNGADATIGYQLTDQLVGRTLHYGGAFPGAPFPGGLGNRSFRFNAAASGSFDVVVGAPEIIEICAMTPRVQRCKTVSIEPAASPGELMITELMINPTSGAAGQWIELRNLSDRTVDLEGFVVGATAGNHTIVGSLPVAPGRFLTLAASAASAGFTPDYVYGTAMALDPLVDKVSISAGTSEIASVSWGVDWTVPQGASLTLETSRHQLGVSSNDTFGRWCSGGAAGSPGALGESCHPYYLVDYFSNLPFIDISVTGTKLMEIGLNSVQRVPLSFSPAMPYFDTSISSFWASPKGWINTTSSNPTNGFFIPGPHELPRSPGDAPYGPLIGFWDRMACYWGEPCGFFHQKGTFNGQEMIVLQWQDFRRMTDAGDPMPGKINFQIQLWQSGTIVMVFGDISHDFPEGSNEWDFFRGGQSWLGLEAPDMQPFTILHQTPTTLAHRSFAFIRR